MAWLGFDSNFEGLSFLDSGILTIDKIPEIALSTDFGWDTFLSTIFASAITGAISYYAIRSNAKSIRDERERQERVTNKQLKAQYVSSNRQQWINELRVNTATFTADTFAFINAHITGYNEYRKHGTLDYDRKNEIKNERRAIEKGMTYSASMIVLLLNPEEKESDFITKKTDEIMVLCNEVTDNEQINVFLLNRHLMELQNAVKAVCKNEWEKIKKHD
ncbi:hypothetical protein M2O40_003897 [Kluyvera ascorbata]|nr:hypothetical protein [Kluyvera ascorbata]